MFSLGNRVRLISFQLSIVLACIGITGCGAGGGSNKDLSNIPTNELGVITGNSLNALLLVSGLEAESQEVDVESQDYLSCGLNFDEDLLSKAELVGFVSQQYFNQGIENFRLDVTNESLSVESLFEDFPTLGARTLVLCSIELTDGRRIESVVYYLQLQTEDSSGSTQSNTGASRRF